MPGARAETARSKLAVVADATLSRSVPWSSASFLAVSTTKAGSQGFPRWGTGARNGVSVSTIRDSSGRARRGRADVLGRPKREHPGEGHPISEPDRRLPVRRVLGERVKDAGLLAPLPARRARQHLRPALAVVEDDREARAAARSPASTRGPRSGRARRMVVVEVEPDLPDRDDLRPTRERLERRTVADRIEVPGLVRMDPDGRDDVLVRRPPARPPPPSPRASSRDQEPRDARAEPFGARAAAPWTWQSAASSIWTWHVASRPESNPRPTSPCSPAARARARPAAPAPPPSPTDAASTMPLDSTPMSFAGFRFATTTTLRPTSASGSYCGRDSGHDLPLLAAQIDQEPHQLVRLRDALGGHDLAPS